MFWGSSKSKKKEESQLEAQASLQSQRIQEQNELQKKYDIQIEKEGRQKIELYQVDKCFNHCVKSFMEKLFSPYERECFNTCLHNLSAFKIEVDNAFESRHPHA